MEEVSVIVIIDSLLAIFLFYLWLKLIKNERLYVRY